MCGSRVPGILCRMLTHRLQRRISMIAIVSLIGCTHIKRMLMASAQLDTDP